MFCVWLACWCDVIIVCPPSAWDHHRVTHDLCPCVILTSMSWWASFSNQYSNPKRLIIFSQMFTHHNPFVCVTCIVRTMYCLSFLRSCNVSSVVVHFLHVHLPYVVYNLVSMPWWMNLTLISDLMWCLHCGLVRMLCIANLTLMPLLVVWLLDCVWL